MRVYLSGAMEFAEDEGANWRKDLSNWLDKNDQDLKSLFYSISLNTIITKFI